MNCLPLAVRVALPLSLLGALAAQAPEARRLQLRYATFDPLLDGPPDVPAGLRAPPDSSCFVLQFHDEAREQDWRELARLGVRAHHVVPQRGFVVRMPPGAVAEVEANAAVRWLGPLQPAFRLAPELVVRLATGAGEQSGADVPRPYDIVMIDDRADREALLARIDALGGRARPDCGAGILQVAELTLAQVVALARHDTVLWIEPTTGVGEDIDNARIQGGANQVEALTGLAGQGVTGMVMEGVYATHVEFAPVAPFRQAPIAVPGTGTSATGSAHGTWTAGEIFSRGARPDARGILPFAQMLYCNYTFFVGTNGRRAVTQAGINGYGQMFETASWGYARTSTYTARSAELDDIIFDLDMPTTQSFGEGPPGEARPTAWCKNVITVGGVCHGDNADPRDDTWCGQATGPAPDGRIKPELVAFYDWILTTDGATNGYRPDMGGTSGATPIVAGYLGLTIELFATGVFGHPPAPGWQQLFGHRPHFTTAKAILVNTARQYPFAGANHDLARMHQGWGFPAAQDALDLGDDMVVVDEAHVLRQGEWRDHWVLVRPGTPELRATMTYADPAANPAAAVQRVNSLDLEVRDPAGVVYFGNQGMDASMFTVAGGTPNDVDTLENVFVQTPPPGIWRVRVAATAVRLDGHVETPGLDADYALVVSGIGGARNRVGTNLDLVSGTPGQLRVVATNLPATWAEGFTVFSASRPDPVVGNGNLLGVELDGLAVATLTSPPGTVFHFANQGPTAYPAVPFDFPAEIASALTGVTLDAAVLLLDARGAVVEVSNAARVTVR
ncbi:MAG: S8 family serine peptidase [Planctomycetes bacterium]|nr:S8 family serine peptidase [Planctomycetota bacterium]